MTDQIDCLAAQCRRELDRKGYAVLEGFLSHEQLEELRLEADTLYELAQEGQQFAASAAAADSSGAAPSMSRWGSDAVASCIYESIPGHSCTPQLRSDPDTYQAHRSRWPLRLGVWRLLFESQLARLVAALLGSQAVLFNDQYIIKPPCGAGAGGAAGAALASSFRWHRDSDWIDAEQVVRAPYISVWCALDDMTSANGCFVVRPGTHRQAPKQQQQQQQQQQQAEQQAQQQAEQQQCQAGAEQHIPAYQQQPHEEQQQQQQQGAQGQVALRRVLSSGELPLEVPAGTAIFTADTLLHASGPNRTAHFRRAWMPQFAAEPLVWRRSGSPVSLAIPLLQRCAPAPSVVGCCASDSKAAWGHILED